ncbi:ferredoxin-type protein NapF [Siculibacillus lacustris]|uniref:Ferredoxin-type protein NapF n=1 Tax=Siculibacillus lacustris TaxID=1549641 RepID=A0A4Q9VX41_9HYPH|nr:ferredoxin-type protein NapF [Siculibacillus lacustris]
MARRDLFRGRLTRPRRPTVPRPPTAIPEADFLAACDGCLACVTACPEGVVRLDADRRPVLQFVHGTCTFCDLCAAACPTGALATEGARPWDARAEIAGNCLAIGGVHCRSCGDACDERAVSFVPRPDGRFLPIIDVDRCTGCGACVGVCPVTAVAVRPAGALREVRA